jgi:hypothetical protein
MRKLMMALVAVTALGFAVPAVTAPADAQTVIVKKKKKHVVVPAVTRKKVTVVKRAPARVHTNVRRSKVVVVKKKPRPGVTVRVN